MGIPSISRMVEEIENVPTSTLEKVLKENAAGGIFRMGRRVPVEKEVIDFFRKVINARNANGILIFKSVGERKRAFKGSGRYKALVSA